MCFFRLASHSALDVSWRLGSASGEEAAAVAAAIVVDYLVDFPLVGVKAERPSLCSPVPELVGNNNRHRGGSLMWTRGDLLKHLLSSLD